MLKSIMSKVIGVGRAVLGVLDRIPMPSPTMVVALLAVIIAASGAAVAAIPSSDGSITACRDKKDGALRVINAEDGQTCTSKETQLAWKDGSTLLGKNEKATDSDKLDGKDSTEFLGANQKAADSDKLDGQDSTAFLGANQKAADSETLDGKDSSEFAAAYKRTVVVSPVGTDTQNGQALLDAINGITDASAAKPYLLYIEPGTYDLGSRTLAMKQYVDIQGAGELRTLITASGSDSICDSPTVEGASNAELRFLTARNTSTGCRVAISALSASPRLTHVTAEAKGAGGHNFGIFIRFGSDPTMTDITATASGGNATNYGVWIETGDPTMTDITATASGPISYGVWVSRANPTIIDLTATASGLETYGVYIDSGSPTITGGTATASGGGRNEGVRMNSGSPTMTGITATASGPDSSHNYGVRVNPGGVGPSGSPTMTDITATASGGHTNEGAHIGNGRTTIRQSTLRGSTYSLRYVPAITSSANRLQVAITQLVGPISSTVESTRDDLQCFDNYDDNLTAVSCP